MRIHALNKILSHVPPQAGLLELGIWGITIVAMTAHGIATDAARDRQSR